MPPIGEVARDRARVVVLNTSFAPGGIEVMRTWYRTQAFPRHSHPYLTLGVMLRGVGTLWLRGETRILRRGDVVVIAPGDVHTGGLGHGDELLSYTALHVPTELLGMDVIASRVTRNPGIASALRRVSAELDGVADVAGAAEAAVSAIGLLAAENRDVSHHLAVRVPEPHFVRVARETIDDCYARGADVSLDALAAAAAVSPFHLVREFTRAIGLSPHRYVIQARLRRAAAMLAAGEKPSDVAATVGFVDQSHLTAHFRRHVGMTPAAYQRGRAVSALASSSDRPRR